MLERVVQNGWRGQLLAEFFLATGRDNQQWSLGGDPGRQRIIGRGVASMEGDQDIEIGNGLIANVADGKLKIGETAFPGVTVVQIDEVGATFDAEHLCAFAK